MAAKLWSAWYDAVLPSLPGLPTGAPADFFIKRAAIEFCDRALVWRVPIPAFQATAATPTYTLAAPVADTMVSQLLSLRFLGKKLTNKSAAWLEDYYGPNQDWRDVTADPPQYWVSEFPNQITLAPFPVSTTAAAIDGWCAVKPTDTATGLDEAIWREYHDEIASLAKARAMEIPRKPYSNQGKSDQLLAQVASSIGQIAYAIERGGGDGTLRTKTHWI
jgi:hypothetical protein